MSERERYIGIGLGAVLVLLVLNYVFLDPYLKGRKALQDQIAKDTKEIEQNKMIERRHSNLVAQWNEMIKGGMKTAPSEAQLQLDTAMFDWALHAGLKPVDRKRQDAAPEKVGGQMYQKSKLHFIGAGTMRAASLMIWSVETGVLPVHIDDVNITSAKEGMDDIKIEMDVTMILPVPDKNATTPRTTVAAAAGAY